MDDRYFDRLTKRVSAAGSRRQVLSALVGAALVGTATGEVAAKRKGKPGKPGKPSKPSKPGKQCRPGAPPEADLCANPKLYPVPSGSDPEHCCHNGFCSCGGKCCGNGCFKTGDEAEPTKVFCCSEPSFVECPAASGDGETCCEGSCEACGDLGQTGISGSYRRR
jgi:hypothetical protein